MQMSFKTVQIKRYSKIFRFFTWVKYNCIKCSGTSKSPTFKTLLKCYQQNALKVSKVNILCMEDTIATHCRNPHLIKYSMIPKMFPILIIFFYIKAIFLILVQHHVLFCLLSKYKTHICSSWNNLICIIVLLTRLLGLNKTEIIAFWHFSVMLSLLEFTYYYHWFINM